MINDALLENFQGKYFIIIPIFLWREKRTLVFVPRINCSWHLKINPVLIVQSPRKETIVRELRLSTMTQRNFQNSGLIIDGLK